MIYTVHRMKLHLLMLTNVLERLVAVLACKTCSRSSDMKCCYNNNSSSGGGSDGGRGGGSGNNNNNNNNNNNTRAPPEDFC